MRTLGIIAGSGQFPFLILREARKNGIRTVVCGLKGSAAPELEKECDVFGMHPIGQVNAIVRFLKEAGVTDLCLGGAVSKPKLRDIHPDLRAAKVLLTLRSKGDTTLLATVISELEKEGFNVIAANSLLPSLGAPAGILTKCRPSDDVRAALEFGWPIARAMGRLDTGQCIVVRNHMIIAVECLEGTDSTLRRGAELGGRGCIAIKLVKPGQDERVDLPSVGLTTIKNLIEGGYAALAVEARKTLFFDMAEALRLADDAGLCIIAVDGDMPCPAK